jgi:hypothetical protein
VRFGVKVRQPAGVKLLQETAHFISYAHNELSRYQDKTARRA